MIVAEKISKSFRGVPAVKDVSFKLEKGGKLVLLGTSGSGKTTTLRMLNRLIEPDSGNVLINGLSILEQSQEQLRRGIGYVLQQHGLFPHYSVEENISIVPKLLRWDARKIHERCIELLRKFKLPPEQFLNTWPDQLSGGQQQRVGLARALAADPPILLMDEPFGALDPITRVSIRNELFKVDELRQKTIVFVTHDIEEAFELGDTICLMHEGIVMQQGSPLDLLFRPENEFVAQFLRNQIVQLELKSLKLQDLWPFLNEGKSETLHQSVFSIKENLWTVFEFFLKNDSNKEIRLVDEETDQIRSMNLSGLFLALNRYKKSIEE